MPRVVGARAFTTCGVVRRSNNARKRRLPKLTMSVVRHPLGDFSFSGRADCGVEAYNFQNIKILACGFGINNHDCGITAGVYPPPRPRIGDDFLRGYCGHLPIITASRP